jgi:putative transposase
LEKARACAFQANYQLIWVTKYRRKVLVGPVEVRLQEILKMIAENRAINCWLLECIMATTFMFLFLPNQRCLYLTLLAS